MHFIIKSAFFLCSLATSLQVKIQEELVPLFVKNCSGCELKLLQRTQKKLVLVESMSRKMAIISEPFYNPSGKTFHASQPTSIAQVRNAISTSAINATSNVTCKSVARLAIHVSSEFVANRAFPCSPLSKVATSAAIQEGAGSLLDKLWREDSKKKN